jgi:chromosome segregation ATPase
MATTKINFTPEHRERLNKLFLSLSFSGEVIQGKFGANTLSPYDLLQNTAINTLKSIHSQLKSEIDKEEKNTDEWTTSEHQQRVLNLKKKWGEFIHLMIGYKRAEQEAAENAKNLRQWTSELAQLKEDTKSPQDRIKEMEDKIKLAEGEISTEVPAPASETPAS